MEFDDEGRLHQWKKKGNESQKWKFYKISSNFLSFRDGNAKCVVPDM